MNAFQIVRGIVKENFYAQSYLPVFLDKGVELLNRAHLYYRSIRILNKIANNPNQVHPPIVGAALHLIGDYLSVASFAINLLLVTKCAQDLLREYQLLSDRYQELLQAVQWRYPVYRSVKWKNEEANAQHWISPSWSLYYQVQVVGLIKQIAKICRCALAVFWQSFKLSMCLCDAHLLLNGDPQARYEACTELVADWDHYRIQLKENQSRLFEEIEKNQALAHQILTRLNTGKTIQTIIEQLKTALGIVIQGVEKVGTGYNKALEETVDSFYVKGKITPLHIAFEAQPLPFPYKRFPPWAGQQVTPKVPTPAVPAAAHFIIEQLKKIPFGEAVLNFVKN